MTRPPSRRRPLATRRLRRAAVATWTGCCALIVGALSSGCTLLVARELDKPAVCSAPGDCPGGQACVDGSCAKVAPAQGPPIVVAAPIGPEGGVVDGPDGVVVTVPAGAVPVPVNVQIARGSETLLDSQLSPRSRVYVITPARDLGAAATVELPVASLDCTDTCRVFLGPAADGAGWTALDSDVVTPGLVRASLRRFGVVVVAVDAPAPPDGGVDAGPDAGPDAGVVDAGSASFAGCDLSPTSCAAPEQCFPDPRDAHAGLCLRPCTAGLNGCACCAPLNDAGPPLCLSAALAACGAP